MRKNLLITGGSGLLAINWAYFMRHNHSIFLGIHKRVVAIDGVQSVHINLTSVISIEEFLSQYQINLVIHTAAMTSVEQCESDPSSAYQANVILSQNVAQACSSHGVKLVHISTDHLFDGLSQLMTEDQPITPLNTYARTKAQAEVSIFLTCPNAIIARTNFFGWGLPYRPSFSDFILNALHEGKEVKLFADAFFTPIYMESLIQTLHHIVDLGASCIYNIVGDERLSKYEFGLRIASKFNLNPNLVVRSFLSERDDLVIRPLDLSLSNNKICSLTGSKIGDLNSMIDKMKLAKGAVDTIFPVIS